MRSAKQENVMVVFDRRAKALQRERAALQDNVDNFDFLKDNGRTQFAERLTHPIIET